jgi:hypothetical protein
MGGKSSHIIETMLSNGYKFVTSSNDAKGSGRQEAQN